MPCWIFIPVILSYGAVFWFTSNYHEEYSSYTYLVGGGLIILTCLQCYCYCCTSRGANNSATKWRENVINRINNAAEDWQQQWPNFAITIIYPIFTRGKKGRIVMIRGIVRVSKGAPQQG